MREGDFPKVKWFIDWFRWILWEPTFFSGRIEGWNGIARTKNIIRMQFGDRNVDYRLETKRILQMIALILFPQNGFGSEEKKTNQIAINKTV